MEKIEKIFKLIISQLEVHPHTVVSQELQKIVSILIILIMIFNKEINCLKFQKHPVKHQRPKCILK